MTSTNTTVVELRQFLAELEDPDEADWEKICDVVDEIAARLRNRRALPARHHPHASERSRFVTVPVIDGPDLPVVLDYLIPHTDAWPEWIRVARDDWVNRFIEGHDEPRLRLAGTIYLIMWGNDDAIVTRLAESPHSAGLRQIYVEEGELSDAAVTALIDSPHLAKLQTLHLVGADITDRAAEAIANSHWNLLSLSIANGQVTNEGVARIAEGTATKNLEFLGLSSNHDVSDEGGILLLKSLPKLQSLDLSQTMVGMFGDELPMYVYQHQDELALVDCDLGDMWEVAGDVREELGYRYNMILE